MRNIHSAILLISISLFLSGCLGGGGSSGTGSSSNVVSSDNLLNYYASSASSGSSGNLDLVSGSNDTALLSSGGLDSEGAVGHHNPEPASLALLGAGLAGLLGAKLRRKK